MNHRAKLLTALVALTGAWPLAAQQAPAPSSVSLASSKPADADPVVSLTPFEVTGSKDIGYQATETLAGTRIRTELRDVGSAISVATKEFMQDIAATDMTSLLQYMTSAEVGGPTGNFSGLGDDSVPNQQGSLLRPGQNTRLRGLDSATNARDFFETDIGWDGYNIGRVDVLRGANSILFGNGSGAGIVSNSPDQATFGRNSAVVDTRYSSFGSYRGSVNMNYVLVPNQLAARVATVHDQRYYQQEPAENLDQRIYGAVRYEPKFLRRGSARTSLKANFETGTSNGNRPRSVSPGDGLTPWFLTAPKQIRSPDGTLLGVMAPFKSHAGYDPFVTAITDAAIIAANPNRRDIGARAALGTANALNSEPWIGRATGPGIAGWQNGGFGAIFSDPASGTMSFYMPQGPGPFYNAIASTGIRDGNIGGVRGVDNAAIVRLDQYSILGVGGRTLANDGFLYERQGVYKNPGIQDPSVYDFYNRLIDGPNKQEQNKFKAFNVQLEQTFFDGKAGFQLALDRQETRDYQLNYLNNDSFITIDVYRYLPLAQLNAATGELEPVLNPNFGRPFIAITPGGSRRKNNRDTWRFTPFADLNFRNLLKSDNLLTQVLGQHTLTGLLEGNELKTRALNFQRWAIEAGNASQLYGPNPAVGTRRIAAVTYLGPSTATNFANGMAGLNISNITATQNFASGPANYFDANYLAGLPATRAADQVWTRTAGLLPSQTGLTTTAASTQSENPANYGGWGLRNLNVVTAQSGAEVSLTTFDNERRDQTKSWGIVDQWSLLKKHIILTGGLRQDKIETFRPGNLATTPIASNLSGNRAQIGTTAAVDYTAPYNYSSTPSFTYQSETLKTWSIVGHAPKFITKHLPWGLAVSGFYNRSANFRPQSRVGVFGDPISPPTGSTKDYGVVISALEGRISLKVNRYDTTVKNASLNDNSVLNFMADEVDRGLQFALAVQNRAGSNGASGNGLYAYRNTADPTDTRWFAYQPATGTAATWTTADWVAADAQAQAQAKAFLDATLQETRFMTAWNINPQNWRENAGNFGLGHSTPPGASVTGDTHSSGTEFELFARPLDNWNISANASHVRAQRLNLAGNLAEFIEKRWALYSGPAGDVRWFGGGNGGGSTIPGARPGDPIADYGRARFGRNGWRWFNEFKAKEGTDVAELRPWRFNVTTNYRFNGKGLGGERLKGLFLGGSFRWEASNIIGYQVKETNPAIGNPLVNPPIGGYDVTKPFYGAKEKHFDLFGGYSRRIFKTIDWRLQLNVRNAFEKDHLVAVNTNPDGSAAGVRISYGPTFDLSSRFEF